MPLFVCEQCKCVENTALSPYWSKSANIWPEGFKGKSLCSECASPVFSDGTKSGYGQWHNEFPKENVDDFLKDNPEGENHLINFKGGKVI